MTGIIDWAAARARMILAFIVLSVVAGGAAYVSLPKEGEPDIEIPALFISVPFPGISAADAEKLLVRPMETELSDLDGLDKMSSTAAEGYAGVALEFEFGWDKTKIIADVRDRMNTVEADFPAGAEKYSINEINFSAFPIIIVNLSGEVPERTLLRVAKDLQESLEALDPVLEAGIAGQRDEMLEVIIDPLRLEAYNVTAAELINVVINNNQLIAAGEVETPTGAFAVKIPSSFDEPQDVYNLPVKTNGDRVVTLGDLAEINLTFEDREGTARFNGETTIALQVTKRKGYPVIDTAKLVQETVEAERAKWPQELQDAINVGVSNDQSVQVGSMVSQLEGSVLTAVALVMIVILGSLGTRSALLVGFAIPTSFLLCFAILAATGITISNMVMFGLILAVGMLVDGAIVVVEYADKRISEGVGPMHAFTDAAKRMFWPIVSSTATTLCAFLPMLFWPGVPGEFMGMLPVTLIYVLSASLVVALVYLPVVGGVAGRTSRQLERAATALKPLPWIVRALLVVPSLYLVFLAGLQLINPGYIFGGESPLPGGLAWLPGGLMMLVGGMLSSITLDAAKLQRKPKKIRAGFRRSPFGWVIRFISGNPVMPLLTIVGVVAFVMAVFTTFGQNNNGVEFFVETEPEQAIVYVRQRGNLSLEEKDAAVRAVEEVVLQTPGIQSAFAFAGNGGLDNNTGGAQPPRDTIGQIQIEMVPWEDRKDIPELDGDRVLEALEKKLAEVPAVKTEILELSNGPASAKPVHLRLKGDDLETIEQAALMVRRKFEETPALTDIEDTLPLPGIDWEISVDVRKAGRYGADVATVGGMVQLVTRGILLDTMRVDSSDEEIEIRVRLPEEDRVLSTLDTLRVRTADGLVPLSNFITREPVAKLAQIDRVDKSRYYDVKAGVASGMTNEAGQPITPTERIAALTEWLETEADFPDGVEWEWTGDNEDQAESGAFLAKAFAGALALMFIILLAQFNSFYNSVLVLLAVVLSTTGVFIGMMVMDQSFSIIMTGTGIVALAGIVVNNNIVLIDTYQEYSRYMPQLEAIARTAQDRIRPVLLTTITTMAGLAPMMFGLSLDFLNGGYTIDSPTALWWKQLATAVVFGLGIATVLTLVVTPSLLALRVWARTGAYSSLVRLKALSMGRDSQAARDLALNKASRKIKAPEIIWDDAEIPATEAPAQPATAQAARAEQPAAEARPDEKPDTRPDPEARDGTEKPDDETPEPPLRAAE
ncbi:Antibiotic efflux pump membrane transporter ArpB [Pseudoruegeria aquimaris]|uniref:Antibiotic efflux pump membrane transporter ArpB n=1 Tax=Pseudoruegeria aquimaris TaxID=393663 RepID=A0A1Y5RPS3_9RHOB|nr:efflux RND transporter permease subunit [Pseudoruegeria aquimaris]SLN22606.1 Antibiotic efflux pump membrane transporter ArpB [Pseudoruegeria aquimaris]